MSLLSSALPVVVAPLIFFATCAASLAQETPPPATPPIEPVDASAPPPFLAGGFDDKPYLHGIFGRIRVGGYLEADAFLEREDGAIGEAGFELVRWNLLCATNVSRHVTVWSEVEFEEGGEEVTLELAQVDVEVLRQINLRAGVLLLPLGRFNLAHDAPRNELPARPFVATELLGVALSQPGLGVFGQHSWSDGARATWEAYAVNGFRDGVILDSPGGTRLPAGKANFEDDNASPSFVGRVAFRPRTGFDLGASAYHGAYNIFREEGVNVDERRDLTIAALDAGARVASFALSGEAMRADLEVPANLGGLYASRQAGFYLQASRRLGGIASWPTSSFTAVARVDAVDFDRDLAGDSQVALTAGLNFRPTRESALKFAWTRGRTRDRFNNAAERAVLRFSLASYF